MVVKITVPKTQTKTLSKVPAKLTMSRGKIKALKKGTVTIAVRSGKIKKIFRLTVKQKQKLMSKQIKKIDN